MCDVSPVWSMGRFMAVYGLYCRRLSFYIKVYHGWGLQRSGPTDPLKENGRTFAPTAPASRLQIAPRQHTIVLLSIRDLASRSLCTESKSKVANLLFALGAKASWNKITNGKQNYRVLPGARFSKVPIINGPGKLSPFTLKIEVSIVFYLTR